MGKCKIIFFIEIVEVENCTAIRNSWFLDLFSATSRRHFYLIFLGWGVGNCNRDHFILIVKITKYILIRVSDFFPLYN